MDPHEGRYPADGLDTSRYSATGLGIGRRDSLARNESYYGLMQNAAPMAESSESMALGSNNPFRDPVGTAPPVPHYQNHQYEDPSRSPPLTGRTLMGVSPQETSPIPQSAWERVAKRTTQSYWQLPDRGGDLGAGEGLNRGDRDVDTMSLDSLQMHEQHHENDEAAAQEPQQDPKIQTFDDYDAYKRSLAAGVQQQQSPAPPSKPPANVKIGRTSGLAIWLLVMSVYSTIMSGIWLAAAIAEPRWGTTVSSHGAMTLSTANLVCAILAKTIEMSFVTVFVAFIGQVLTRRAMTTREGMTLSEMSMRTWVTQPGSLLANARTLRYAGRTVLGVMTLIATIVVIFYTTASDTMVAPKLQMSKWKPHELKSYIKSSYANSEYIESNCATPISLAMDSVYSAESCLDVQNAGNSWPDIFNFVSSWAYTSNASTSLKDRPRVESMLYDNVTVYGTWIETQYSDVSASYDRWSRIVNNVSLAMPHPGVYTAAINESMNRILQPSDLDGTGSYNVTGSVVSPAVNVLCVNMDKDELAPLVYTAWPHANTTTTGIDDQFKAAATDWDTTDVPVYSDTEWLNSTVVDDIFRWGEKYNRRPPVFELYPYDNNFYANASMPWPGASVYFLAKSRFLENNYTVCELRSWAAIQCSTRFDVSGTTGMSMSADCSQDEDYYPQNATLFKSNPDAYVHHMNASDTIADSGDWRFFAQGWVTSLSLSGGQQTSNSSVSRILTECALQAPQLNTSLPSIAEGFAAFLANTLVTSALDTPFIHYWAYNETILPGAGELVTFPARVRSQEYASWHTEDWQGIFYIVLVAAFLLNLLCLLYLCRVGLVKDFLEPTSLFALATSASASMVAVGGGITTTAAATPGTRSLRGVGEQGETSSMLARGGTSNEKAQLVVPYRLAYRQEADHYVFEEAADDEVNANNGLRRDTAASGVELEEGVGRKRRSYVRLSAKPIF